VAAGLVQAPDPACPLGPAQITTAGRLALVR
jgi:hypothetical protein